MFYPEEGVNIHSFPFQEIDEGRGEVREYVSGQAAAITDKSNTSGPPESDSCMKKHSFNPQILQVITKQDQHTISVFPSVVIIFHT